MPQPQNNHYRLIIVSGDRHYDTSLLAPAFEKEEAFMYEKILVPLDGSQQSEEVLPWVRMLAEVSKAEIVLLRVAEYPYTLYSMCYEYPPSDPNLAKTIQAKKTVIYHEAKDYLEQTASALAKAGIKVSIEVCEGPVVAAILAFTDRLHIDLIALSMYGQSGGIQRVIGAVADRVLHEAPVPVILIRPPSRSFIPDPPIKHRVPLSV
jgi:nucleotide-binding universal stress UspA family protein